MPRRRHPHRSSPQIRGGRDVRGTVWKSGVDRRLFRRALGSARCPWPACRPCRHRPDNCRPARSCGSGSGRRPADLNSAHCTLSGAAGTGDAHGDVGTSGDATQRRHPSGRWSSRDAARARAADRRGHRRRTATRTRRHRQARLAVARRRNPPIRSGRKTRSGHFRGNTRRNRPGPFSG